AGQEAIEGSAEAVDVGPRPEPPRVAGGLLGAHVGGGADRRAGDVSALPLAEDGTSVRSSVGPPGTAWPRGLARPPPATGVPPPRPTRTLPGLTSRCSTPRRCAYSIALQTSTNRRSSFRSSSALRPGSCFSAASWWKAARASLRLSPLMNRMA